MSVVCRQANIAHEAMYVAKIFREDKETQEGDVNENCSGNDGRDEFSKEEEAQENGLKTPRIKKEYG
jgi:hypothetical protein